MIATTDETLTVILDALTVAGPITETGYRLSHPNNRTHGQLPDHELTHTPPAPSTNDGHDAARPAGDHRDLLATAPGYAHHSDRRVDATRRRP